MSGGRWDHGQPRINNVLDDICHDEAVKKRWPKIRVALSALRVTIYEVIHDMDGCLSGDVSIDDDEEFDRKCSKKLLGKAVDHLLTEKEIATVLASLSHWRDAGIREEPDFRDGWPQFERVEPLTDDEIDQLYDRLDLD